MVDVAEAKHLSRESDMPKRLPVNFDEFLASIEARKIELRIVDDEAWTEAMRNRGELRTPEKRAFLKRIAERAWKAGVEPLKAYY